MPEIAELEAFKTYVNKHAINKKIADVKSPDKSLLKKTSFPNLKKTLLGKKFSSSKRIGKYLIIAISGTDNKIVMHFGLTGSLAYKKHPDEKVKYAKVIFIFSDGSALHWTNRRKFGSLWLIKDLNKIPALRDIGPDPLKLTPAQFKKLSQEHSGKNIKSFFMNQSIISGIGNEYSDEILFQAGIDPHHKIEDLSPAQLTKLYKKMQEVLKYAINLRTKNFKKIGEILYFSNPDREKFKSSYLQAHRHTDKKCPKNASHKLKKVTIAGRSTYYCPKDQK